MTNPQIKTQAKVQAYEGISLKTIQQKGSDGQKIMAPLFDTDGNGKLEGLEVKRFNSSIFKTEPGKVTMYDRSNDLAKPFVAEITYDKGGFKGTYDGWALKVQRDDNYLGTVEIYGTVTGNAKINLANNTALIKDVDTKSMRGAEIYSSCMDLTVKDSKVAIIDMCGGDSLKLKNTKDNGILDTKTRVNVYDSKTAVNADDKSKVNVNERFLKSM